MIVYFYTTKGVDKAESEDRVLVGQDVYSETKCSKKLESGTIAVADGVGGNLGGSVAAQFVCEEIGKLKQPRIEDFERINDDLFSKSSQNALLRGMATVLSGISFGDSTSPYIFHTGNTRVYAIQAGQYLNQLTKDDTVVSFLVRTGRLTEDEAENYPAKNEITACFGGEKKSLLNISFIMLDNEINKQFLLTCDGIHDVLSIDELEDIVASAGEDWERVINDLVTKAKENGSRDDCTAMIVDLE